MYHSLAQQVSLTEKLEQSWIVDTKINDLQAIAKLQDGSFIHIFEEVDVDERGRKCIFKTYHPITSKQFEEFVEEVDYMEEYEDDAEYEEPPVVMEEDYGILTAKILKRLDLCGIIIWSEVHDLTYCKNIQWMREELARLQIEFPHTAFKLVVEYA